MPRSSRIDLAGLLQHVIVRGIEQRNIFFDDVDRRFFLSRFSKLLEEMKIDCFAWALLPNHFHLLLRPKQTKLAAFMRRLLTSYAVYFNLRHSRSGHLFQNRYKSIVCQSDPYLLELIRYIHLNPFRAGLVRGMNELDSYPWSGHAVIMGNQKLPEQTMDEMLRYFSNRVGAARKRYREFIMDGISQGRRDELVGGGLRRSQALTGLEQIQVYDERVLGNGDFIEQLKKDKEISDRLPSVLPLKELLERIARVFNMEPEQLKQRSRKREFVEARNILSYLALREMRHNGAELARMLNVSRSAVCISAERGKEVVRKNPTLRKIIKVIKQFNNVPQT
jgi:REP element-mobilizing transposase RayT